MFAPHYYYYLKAEIWRVCSLRFWSSSSLLCQIIGTAAVFRFEIPRLAAGSDPSLSQVHWLSATTILTMITMMTREVLPIKFVHSWHSDSEMDKKKKKIREGAGEIRMQTLQPKALWQLILLSTPAACLLPFCAASFVPSAACHDGAPSMAMRWLPQIAAKGSAVRSEQLTARS